MIGFDKFKSKEMSVMRVSALPEQLPRRGILGTPLRVGMWVLSNGHVGVLHSVLDERDTNGMPLAEVHLTDKATGDTVLVEKVPLLSLTQAKHNDIPEARRPHPALSESLGY